MVLVLSLSYNTVLNAVAFKDIFALHSSNYVKNPTGTKMIASHAAKCTNT